ncbi:XRE family transcriptional regulator (plasmid) [Fructilactobacillus ixorae]|uniref:XRE family transcriptional regulator n=1 Tax=Fructilactobacillus ixorae TaxID=1750535 RepID=A0ABY5C9H1_9LACO|nr:XRE family transcriptional regulator [Fructilactobacillus ixorae]USS93961.1 XRE family transcriptional regulator [Fructilactobacillus ixorae]
MDNKAFGNELRNIRKEKNFTIRQVALQAGMNHSFISQVENGKRNIPKPNTLRKIAKGLRISENEIFHLAGLDVVPDNMQPIDESKMTTIPILGEIACGDPILAVENIVGSLDVPTSDLKNGYKYFALQTVGDSMLPTIPRNSIVTIRMQPDAEDGQIVAALLEDDNSATIKRLKKTNGKVILKPDNESYSPIVLSEDRPGRILGIVISATQKFN